MNNLSVAIIQSDLHWEEVDANLAMFEEKIWKIEGKSDLIILPEMFNTGFSMNAQKLGEPMNSRTFRWMKQNADQTGAVIMGSYIIKEKSKYYNRLFAVKPDGSFEFYDKKHLFGYGGEDRDFTPGQNRLIFEWKGWRILPMICYDLRFPVWIRSRKSDERTYEYDLSVFVANWPSPRVKAWDTLLQARAIENLSYAIGVNRIGTDGAGLEYVGHSAVYNFKGEEVRYLGSEDTISTESLDFDAMVAFREKVRFQEDGDNFSMH